MEAITYGENAFTAGTNAVTTLAQAVSASGEHTNLAAVSSAAVAVSTSQAPAHAGLAACAADKSSPQVCVHSATVLQQASRSQVEQARTLVQIARAAAAGNQGSVDVGLSQLASQQSALQKLVTTVNDTDCAQAAGTEAAAVPELDTP